MGAAAKAAAAKKVPAANGSGQFGDISFLNNRKAYKAANDKHDKFRKAQNVLTTKRNTESEIYFKSKEILRQSRATAFKAKEDLDTAKDAHTKATAEVFRLGGVKKTQTKTRNDTKNAWTTAKDTHKKSLGLLTTLKAKHTTAAAVVTATQAQLVKDNAAALEAKKKSDA